jgi:16S rRNA processing protein RimM
MLKKEDFAYLGKFLKPHGTRGEIGLQGDVFMLDDERCNFVACDIDGILVPFFFEEIRQKNDDTLIVKVERMESAEEVRYLTNRDAYIPRQWSEESEEVSLSYFMGFTATDVQHGTLGIIADVDESTVNTLFVIDGKDGELLIPAQEEFIAGIDHDRREIVFDLPEGLVSL